MKGKMYLLMVVVLALTTLLAACGNGGRTGETQKQAQTEKKSDASNGDTAPAAKEDMDPLGKYEETIHMTFFAQKDDSVKFNAGESWEDNLWTRHYLDKLNIQVEDKWIVDASQYDQQVAMSITSRDLADVMSFKVGDKNLQTLYENDQLDISYFVTTEKYQEPFKLAKLAIAQPDKNIQIWKACTAAQKGDTSLIEANKEAEQNFLSMKQWEENPVAENNQGWGYTRIFGEGGSIGVLNDYEQKNALIIDEFYGGSTPTMSSKMATLNTMQLETYTKIITGEADISAYDEFVEKWNSLGGTDITNEVNEWYSAH